MDEVNDASFEAEVLQSSLPVVVDFWAPWCGPCRAVESVLEEFAAEHAEAIRFAKLNVDDNLVIPSRYGVLALPTVILFESGEPQESVVGARSRRHYDEAWARWLATP